MLAGLIRSPNRSPHSTTSRKLFAKEMRPDAHAKARVHYGTADGLRHGIDARDRCETEASPQENWAMDSILRELELVIDRDQFDNGGLRIYTTIDGALQNVAEASLRKRLLQIESLPGFPHKAMKVYRPEDSEDGPPISRAPPSRSTAARAESGRSREAGITSGASSTGPCLEDVRSALL